MKKYKQYKLQHTLYMKNMSLHKKMKQIILLIAKPSHEFFLSLAAIENSTTHLSTRNEIDAYFSEPETNVESLLWWKANVKQYPILAYIAMDYLAIQATSVASEQIFSTAKHTVSPTHINPEVTRTSLCLKSWYVELN
jgi:hypothetical protein